jgi:hypothetical protein
MQGHVNRDRKTYKYTLKVLISSGKPQICKKKTTIPTSSSDTLYKISFDCVHSAITLKNTVLLKWKN